MYQLFIESCSNLSSCSETILWLLWVIFIGAPMVAIGNMILPRYIIVSLIFFSIWISYFFLQKKHQKYIFLLRWWAFGIILFWIGTALRYHHGFPLPARDLPICGACWSDYPPYSSLFPIFWNILLYQLIGCSVAYLLQLHQKNHILLIVTMLSLFISIQGFAFVAILFD
jgi:hypothetical protein